MFNESNEPGVAYCGYDKSVYADGFHKFIDDLKKSKRSSASGSSTTPMSNSLEQVQDYILEDGHRYTGWGYWDNREFGYYQDSRLKVNLTDFVQWYYEGALKKSDRSDENMLSMYTSKETKQMTTLLIGYPSKNLGDGFSLACMGFRFKADGSVW